MHVDQILGEVVLATKTVIRVCVTKHSENREKVDVRIWFKNFEGLWQPTKKGFTFLRNNQNVGQLVEVLKKSLIL